MLNMNNTIFAERLREARTAAKITQAELSKKAGVTAATISAYESYDGSKGKNPSLDNALKLAVALNVSLDWLCGFSVKTDRAPIIEFIKMMVALDEHTDISFDKIDLADEAVQGILTKTFSDIDYEEYLSDQFSCEEYGVDFTYPIYVAVYHDLRIQKFIGEWQKMRDLYKSNTIDKDLYNLWLNKQYMEIEAILTADDKEGVKHGNDQETE